MLRFRPTEEEVGQRIDIVVTARSGVPRAVVRDAVKSGSVTVDGRPVRPGYRLSAEDDVEGVLEAKVEAVPEGEAIPLDVRYSDDRVLVISKPAGLVTHPATGHETGTLVNALLAGGGPLSSINPMRPGIVHRLDKDTSGLLLVARDDEAHNALAGALKRREIVRKYYALVRGVPSVPSGTVEAPIGRHPTYKRRQAVTPDGKDAVTHYRVVQAGEGLALLEVSLETGRTHQIRVHLSHIKHPVMGDPTYGGRSERSIALGLTRPFLHAYKLVFPHPTTGELVELEDPLPEDLARALAAAGLAAIHNPEALPNS